MVPPFYVVIRATPSSSRFAGQRKNFHFSVILRPSLLSFAVRRSTVWANPAAVFSRVSWMQTQSDNPVNQSEFTANARSRCQAREKPPSKLQLVEFCFLIGWETEASFILTHNNIQNHRHEITLDTLRAVSLLKRVSFILEFNKGFESPIVATPPWQWNLVWQVC